MEKLKKKAEKEKAAKEKEAEKVRSLCFVYKFFFFW